LAKHLTDEEIIVIIDIVDGWGVDRKLSWDNLISAFFAKCARKTTRQALDRNNRIKLAFQNKKDMLKDKLAGNESDKQSLPPSLKIAGNRIQKLESKISRLEVENSRLLEQFQVWQYNAYKRGITIQQSSEPLPASDRESSE